MSIVVRKEKGKTPQVIGFEVTTEKAREVMIRDALKRGKHGVNGVDEGVFFTHGKNMDSVRETTNTLKKNKSIYGEIEELVSECTAEYFVLPIPEDSKNAYDMTIRQEYENEQADIQEMEQLDEEYVKNQKEEDENQELIVENINLKLDIADLCIVKERLNDQIAYLEDRYDELFIKNYDAEMKNIDILNKTADIMEEYNAALERKLNEELLQDEIRQELEESISRIEKELDKIQDDIDEAADYMDVEEDRDDGKFFCGICNYRTNDEQLWSNHLISIYHDNKEKEVREADEIPELIDAEFDDDMPELVDAEDTDAEWTYFCDKCQYGTDNIGLWQQHIGRTVHQNKVNKNETERQPTYCCNFCGYTSEYYGDWYEHVLLYPEHLTKKID
jgi:hypothetical protein